MSVGISPQAAPLDDLYREIILDHYRHPRHRGEVTGATGRIEASNPLCGDEVALSWRTEDGRLDQVGFTGQGCSICMAATSMLCDGITGLDVPAALELVGRFRAMLVEGGSAEGLDDLEALHGVAAYPVRIKCAVLAGNALAQGLGEERARG